MTSSTVLSLPLQLGIFAKNYIVLKDVNTILPKHNIACSSFSRTKSLFSISNEDKKFWNQKNDDLKKYMKNTRSKKAFKEREQVGQ